MKDERAEIGIIGGSGLYELAELADVETVRIDTPFGSPSDVLRVGTLCGRRTAFVPRHGRGHRVPPSVIPVRENIYALKALGVCQVISIGAVGSLRDDYEPGHLVVPYQIVDWTKGLRPTSFFGEGLVVHASLANPYCELLRDALVEAARRTVDVPVHDGGTYVCIEGPQFSTRAESELYRSLGMDIIGMTAVPEARLAREAELCYVGLALVTDYDSWRSGAQSVDADLVTAVMADNVEAAKKTLVTLIGKLSVDSACLCREALARAIITDRNAVPRTVRDRLGLLVGRYFTD